MRLPGSSTRLECLTSGRVTVLKPSLNLFGDFLEISAARGQAFASVRQEVASSRKKQGRRREFITSSVGLDCFSFGFLAQLIANFLYRRESTMMMLRLSLVAGLAGGTPLRQLSQTVRTCMWVANATLFGGASKMAAAVD